MNGNLELQRRSIQIMEEELDECIRNFYCYFEDGFVFEQFLKYYLEKLGLDEVSITQRTRDSGIDLKAVRPGVGSFNQNDAVNYYVQAKRYSPDSKISVAKIRELRGVLPAGYRGIFITTASFSRDAIREAEIDPSRLIILIDGKSLIETCIEYEIGFVFVPRFSSASLRQLMHRDEIREDYQENQLDVEILEITKNITFNDIRARILSIPKEIFDKLDENIREMKVEINGVEYDLALNRDRKYFAGVTSIYRSLNLIASDGVFHPTTSIWRYYTGKIVIQIEAVV